MIKHLLIALAIVFGTGAVGCLVGWLAWSAPSLGLVVGEAAGAGGLVLALWLLGRIHVN